MQPDASGATARWEPAMIRFRIRDLLWLNLIFAISVAWGLDHFRAAEREGWRNYHYERLGILYQNTKADLRKLQK